MGAADVLIRPWFSTRIIVRLLWTALVLCSHGIAGADQLPFPLISGEGKTAVLVLPANPSRGERKAADELARMVKRMSNLEPAVVQEPAIPGRTPLVFIGATAAAQDVGLPSRLNALPDDSFSILSQPEQQRLFLCGKGDLGSFYAVVYLLESRCGLSWFFPDELGMVIPQLKELGIPPLDENHSPDFPLRAVGWKRAQDWSLFNGSNVNLDEELGKQVFKHSHTFNEFLPPGRYFKAHPEYYAQVKGVRNARQLDTSNPEVIEVLSRNIIQFLKERPRLDMITLFPGDGLGFCECPRCKALDESGVPTVEEINTRWNRLGPDRHRALSRRMLIFYLEVAKRVLREYPNVLIQVGAYNPYLYPPKDRSLKAPPNVLIEMCHGWDHNFAIDSPASEINVRFKEALAGWREIFTQVSIYEYYWKMAMFDLPFPIVHTIAKDIPIYLQSGVKAFYTQFGRDYYTNGLNYYVASKLLWNSKADADALVDEFCRRFYGKAWQPMREYFRNYEQAAVQAGITLACPVADLDRIFTPALLAGQQQRLTQALEMADSKEARARIERAQISLNYVKMCMEYLGMAKAAVKDRSYLSGAVHLRDKAGEIRAYRNQHDGSLCFSPENNYTRRFLDFAWILMELTRGRRSVDDQ
jgi:hypothetical protein